MSSVAEGRMGSMGMYSSFPGIPLHESNPHELRVWTDLWMGVGTMPGALPFSSPLGHLEEMSGSTS